MKLKGFILPLRLDQESERFLLVMKKCEIFCTVPFKNESIDTINNPVRALASCQSTVEWILIGHKKSMEMESVVVFAKTSSGYESKSKCT